jgi:hypothetical protein
MSPGHAWLEQHLRLFVALGDLVSGDLDLKYFEAGFGIPLDI